MAAVSSITSMKRLTVITVVSVVIGAVASTTRVVAAMRTPGVAIAIIASVNPDIIIAEKTIMVATVVVVMTGTMMCRSIWVIHTRTQEDGTKQADRERQEGLHGAKTERTTSLFWGMRGPQYGKSCFVPN